MLNTNVARVCAVMATTTIAAAQELKLPPEVTPALRAACESDVRRLGCIGPQPTYSKVKSCVVAKYHQLGQRCKVELAQAGYSGPSHVPRSSVKASVKTPAKKEAGFFKPLWP
jgi:hypothetical protein